jgi:MraZ protein
LLVLFTGRSEHVIDKKLRLAVPAKYRNQWSIERDGSAWFCIPWPEGRLRLYTQKRFEDLAERGADTLTPSEDMAEFETTFFGSAERLEQDEQGRVVLPKEHLELAKIGSEVVIVGARTRLEVWDKATWKAGEEARFRRLPTLVERIDSIRTPSKD